MHGQVSLPGKLGGGRMLGHFDGGPDRRLCQARQRIVAAFGPRRVQVVLQGQEQTHRHGLKANGVLTELIQVDLDFRRTLEHKLGRLVRTGFFNGPRGVFVGTAQGMKTKEKNSFASTSTLPQLLSGRAVQDFQMKETLGCLLLLCHRSKGRSR